MWVEPKAPWKNSQDSAIFSGAVIASGLNPGVVIRGRCCFQQRRPHLMFPDYGSNVGLQTCKGRCPTIRRPGSRPIKGRFSYLRGAGKRPFLFDPRPARRSEAPGLAALLVITASFTIHSS